MIAIPNMDKPKKCDECWALDDKYDYPMCLITQEQRGYDFNTMTRVMDFCPLIDIVTCKDCKNSHMTYGGQCKYCDLMLDDDDNYIECYFDGDHFCGFGERRSDEGIHL